MINSFEDAKNASEEIFENVPNSNTDEIGTEQATASGNAESGGETLQTDMLEQATQTAELAANAAKEKNAELDRVLAEIEALKTQNSQLQGTIDELSKQNEDKLIKEAFTPPVLDINGLAFADEETQRAAIEKFSQDMAEYNRKQIMEEISPAMEYAKKGMQEAEKSEAIEALSQIPQLSGIKDMIPQLDKIIANNAWLSDDNMPVDEKYINAYTMARGVNAINNPPKSKAPDTTELMRLYNNNLEFREAIERQRLEQIKTGQQVPTFSADSGAAGAALNIQERPKTFEEALMRSKQQLL